MLEGKVILAIDFDGCITTERDMGNGLVMRPNCKEVLTKWYEEGHTLILWTCRTGISLVEALTFLDSNGLRDNFSAVNDQIPEIIEKYHPEVARKVGADYYFDDRFPGLKVDWLEFDKALTLELSQK